MAGLAFEYERVSILSRDRANDADGKCAGLQQRALLDMDLEVRQRRSPLPPVVVDSVRVAPERAHRLAHCDALTIGPVDVCCVQRSRHGAAAEVGRPESQSLLIGESEDLGGKGMADALFLQALVRHDLHYDSTR